MNARSHEVFPSRLLRSVLVGTTAALLSAGSAKCKSSASGPKVVLAWASTIQPLAGR